MEHHDAGLAGLQRRRGSPRSAGTTRSRTSSVVSSPGTGVTASSAQPGGVLLGEAAPRTPRASAPSACPRRTRAAGRRARWRGRSPRRRTRRSAGPGRGRSTTAATGRSAASTGATVSAWARPTALSGTSACPCARPTAFQSVSPCRTRTRVRASGTVGFGGDVRRELDQRAVAPQPLEGVELPLLLVLHVHDDVAVVDQHPPAVALALAADRLARRSRGACPRPRRRSTSPGGRWSPRRAGTRR